MWEYDRLKNLVRGRALPVMLVDLDILDSNIARIEETIKNLGKTLRIATKSIRVPHLIDHILQTSSLCKGLMCFSAEEMALLAKEGFDDLLLAYPTVQKSDLEILWDLTQRGVHLTVMVDEFYHLERLNHFWGHKKIMEGRTRALPLKVCIEMDMSLRPVKGLFHIGVRRSPLHTLSELESLLDKLNSMKELKLVGLMGYEAQIAGLPDKNPFSPLLNPIKQRIRKKSASVVAKKRQAIDILLKQKGISLEFFNGGGTGSLQSSPLEACLTEVTAGSGFLHSHLFDYYHNVLTGPACCFALQVTRLPAPGWVTCQSGGFIASGEIGLEKAPIPFRPRGLKSTKNEGFGEVQTPLKVPEGITLLPGDPVFFRPAKAGEIAEHFGEYLLIRKNEIVGQAKTYRGMGYCFH